MSLLPYDNTGVTVELRHLIECGVDIFSFDYPSYYKGEEKKAFEQKIIDHYYFRQIGQETPARFIHKLKTKLREIMPYYIQLYKSVELLEAQEDPLESYHLEETFQRTTEGSVTGESGENATRKFSNTPQGTIHNLDDHLTEATVEEAGTTNTSSNEGSENYTLIRRGNIGVQPLGDELTKLRAAFINVDMQVIDELNDLFLLVY